MASGSGSAARHASRVVQPQLDGTQGQPEELGYSGPHVCKIVGISYRQLDYWARTDLVRLKVIKSLLDAGVKLQTARKAIEYLREDLGEDWAHASLVLNGASSVLARSGDDLIDVVRQGQGVLNIVSLGPVVEELNGRIHELAPEAATSTPSAAARAVEGG